MIIRKAKSTDAQNLKKLYFDFLTHFPPKEEQDTQPEGAGKAFCA